MSTRHIYQNVHDALESLRINCDVPTDLPDRQFLRVHVPGDAAGSKNLSVCRQGRIVYVKYWKTGEVAHYYVTTCAEFGAPAAASTVSSEEAAALATRLMRECPLATTSAYFSQKGIDVSSFRLRQVSANELCYNFGYTCLGRSDSTFVVVPAFRIVKNGANLSTCQLIGGTPVKKHFLKAGTKKGAFWLVRSIPKSITAPTIGVAEGVATAISAWKLFKDSAALTTVAAAFDSGNLLPVCKSLRKHWPQAQLIVFADNDRPESDLAPNVEHSVDNCGVSHATSACRAVGARLHAPSFDAATRETFLRRFGKLPTDWNDVEVMQGLIHDGQ